MKNYLLALLIVFGTLIIFDACTDAMKAKIGGQARFLVKKNLMDTSLWIRKPEYLQK
jgi:hypothetical protein